MISYHVNDRAADLSGSRALKKFKREIISDYSQMTNRLVAPTSARLRTAATVAVEEFQRPFTVQELEQWIAENDYDLWLEVSQKCDDYVRILLSLSSDGSLIRYKLLEVTHGTAQRASFFGARHAAYDPAIWCPIVKKGKRTAVKSQRTRESKLTSQAPIPRKHKSIFFPDHMIFPLEPNVDDATYEYSWFVLQTLVASTSDFWSKLRAGIAAMKEKAAAGCGLESELRQILQADDVLTHPTIAKEVVNILSWEAMTEKRRSPCDPRE